MKMKLFVFFFLLSPFAYCLTPSASAQSITPPPQARETVIVKLKSAPKALTLMSINSSLTTGTLAGGLPSSNYLLVHANGNAQATIDELQKNNQVASAFPSARMKAFVLTNDQYVAKQWPLVQMNIANTNGVAWNLISNASSKTAQVKVAVIDSGIDRTHPDLAGKIADEDWVKCAADYTANVVNCGPDSSGIDDNGHGTHVGGIIGALPDNSIGIAGVALQTKLMSIKVLDAAGNGDMIAALEGMLWAVDHGAKVINMSLGTVETMSANQIALFQEYVDKTWNKGAVIVAAAGNCGSAQTASCAPNVNIKSYPAASNHVIAVAALSPDNTLAVYSQHNDATQGNWISVAAPGGYCSLSTPDSCVLSTWSKNASASSCSLKLTNEYCYEMGTSMASPHVAGLAVLLFAANPNLTNDQVKSKIESSANHSVASSGTTNGLIDVSAAITSALGTTGTITPSPTGSIGPSATSVPPTPIPLPTRVQNCTVKPTHARGNANDDCYIDELDLMVWKNEISNAGAGKTSDFNGDGKVNLTDFEIWRRNYSSGSNQLSLTPMPPSPTSGGPSVTSGGPTLTLAPTTQAGGCRGPSVTMTNCGLNPMCQSPPLSDSCASCMNDSLGLRASFDGWGWTGQCTITQIANHWCNGGISADASEQCEILKQSDCASACGN